jgi:hypothetical protein
MRDSKMRAIGLVLVASSRLVSFPFDQHLVALPPAPPCRCLPSRRWAWVFLLQTTIERQQRAGACARRTIVIVVVSGSL